MPPDYALEQGDFAKEFAAPDRREMFATSRDLGLAFDDHEELASAFAFFTQHTACGGLQIVRQSRKQDQLLPCQPLKKRRALQRRHLRVLTKPRHPGSLLGGRSSRRSVRAESIQIHDHETPPVGFDQPQCPERAQRPGG